MVLFDAKRHALQLNEKPWISFCAGIDSRCPTPLQGALLTLSAKRVASLGNADKQKCAPDCKLRASDFTVLDYYVACRNNETLFARTLCC